MEAFEGFKCGILIAMFIRCRGMNLAVYNYLCVVRVRHRETYFTSFRCGECYEFPLKFSRIQLTPF